MPTEAANIAAPKACNDPVDGWALPARLVDKRTRAWKRRCELVATFTDALGGEASVDPILANKIAVAAELAAIAEMARGAFMAGKPGVTADDLVRMSNQAARAERALGIEARQAKPAGPSLADYLAGKGRAA